MKYYYVVYVEDSCMTIKKFKTSRERSKFIKEFKEDVENGWWIDFTFTGKIDKYFDQSFVSDV